MDFTQFISLLENDELFFSKASEYDDPFEGSLPQSHEEEAREDVFFDKSINWAVELLPKFRKICKKYTYLSCWHLNNGESAAMWDIYLKSNQGICIQSTVNNLIDSISTDKPVYISEVEYIDYEEDEIPGWQNLGDSISPFIHKRDSFQHESELRAIIQDLPWHENSESEITPEEIRNEPINKENNSDSDENSGKSVSVDLDQLIDTIRISPEADDWIEELAADVCESYEIDADLIIDSKMTRDPFH